MGFNKAGVSKEGVFGGGMSESLDEQIVRSGKDIFPLHTDKEALDFWNEPAKAKVVLMYLQGCSFCHKFAPVFIKAAPTKANSDLLFGSASHTHLDKVMKFIPALHVNGFPTTILVDAQNKVQHVIPGYIGFDEFVDAIFSKFPTLKTAPTLEYLRQLRQAPPAATLAAGSSARLPSTVARSIDAKETTSLRVIERKVGHGAGAAATAAVPGLVVGSGIAAANALPIHLRIGNPSAAAATTMPVSGAGRKRKSSKHRHHHHHQHRIGGATEQKPEDTQNQQQSWCNIL